jgi:hypothetical protein
VRRRRPFRRNAVHSRVKLLRNPSPRRPLFGCEAGLSTVSSAC